MQCCSTLYSTIACDKKEGQVVYDVVSVSGVFVCDAGKVPKEANITLWCVYNGWTGWLTSFCESGSYLALSRPSHQQTEAMHVQTEPFRAGRGRNLV